MQSKQNFENYKKGMCKRLFWKENQQIRLQNEILNNTICNPKRMLILKWMREYILMMTKQKADVKWLEILQLNLLCLISKYYYFDWV